MARLLTALALLLAVTVSLASFASTAAARSDRLRGIAITADGASGAVDTASGVITAESAPSVAQRSAGDEQGRRRELVGLFLKSDCAAARKKNCNSWTHPTEAVLIQQLPSATPSNTGGLPRLGACNGGGGNMRGLPLAAVDITSLVIMWVFTLSCG
ncbi:unnamed protein product [Closterium sp. NIES-54]